MQLEILPDAEAVAMRGGALVAAAARAAVLARGRFVMAVSGGTTPWRMLRELAELDVPWDRFHFVQVDERVAPDGHPDRNLTHLRESLRASAALREDQVHPMLVNAADLERGAAEYAQTLATLAGVPAVLDLVHLGLGSDGHTASLVPGDAVLDRADVDVASTDAYQGRRRMTLTYPILNRAREILWLVTGESKREMLTRLRAGDERIPAGRIRASNSTILADCAAAGVSSKEQG